MSTNAIYFFSFLILIPRTFVVAVVVVKKNFFFISPFRLNRHAEERDELRTSVKKVLENANKDQPKPKTFERKWALVKHKISSGLQFSRQKSIQASRVTDPSTSARSQVHQGFFG